MIWAELFDSVACSIAICGCLKCSFSSSVSFNRDLSQEFGILISSFSPSGHEIHFQREFFEGNVPLISLNIMIPWVRSVSTNTCNWSRLDQDN